MRKLSKILFILSVLIITIAFNFQDNPPSNWTQQFLPDLGGRQITDMAFIDSLNGFAVTDNLSPGDIGYILKTTNGGDNWNFSLTINRGFSSIKFINLNTGYACGGSGGGTTYLAKTTNSGVNWFSVNCPSAAKWKDMFLLSEDTIWLVDNDGLTGGVFRTTNGGANWETQFSSGTLNPDKIYMFNARIGFMTRSVTGAAFYKTTNSGANWISLGNSESFFDMKFLDSLTGWKAYGTMKKTTNGGLNWIDQPLPGGSAFITEMRKFSVINKDTIIGVGGVFQYPNFTSRAILYKTTNGGNLWGYQVADTSFGIYKLFHIKFTDKNIGWAFAPSTGIHTKVGGDTTFLTDVTQSSTEIPTQYKLYQNYPNPFNPSTIISYQLTINSFVVLKVFDVNGREISELVNKKQSAGSYSVEFNGANLPSGIYFYTLEAEDFNETKKMVLLK